MVWRKGNLSERASEFTRVKILNNRTALIPLLLLIISSFLVSGLAAGRENSDPGYFVYLPVAAASDVLYRDDFSDADSGWPVVDEGDFKWSYQNGEYEMLILPANFWAGALAPVSGLDAYGIEADMYRSEGNLSEYGLIFDFRDWDNFSFLTVDPGKQSYAVVKFVDKVAEFVVPRTKDEASIQPNNGVNHVRLDRNGSQIIVTINGNQLSTVNESEFVGDPGVGLFMWGDEDVPARVRYDNFVVRELGAGMAESSRIRLTESSSSSGSYLASDLKWFAEE